MAMWMRWAACAALAWAGVAGASPPGIEVELEEDSFELQFDRAMAVLGNAPVPEVTLSPAMPMTCTWTDDHALGCMLDDDRTLPPASRIEIRIAPGLQHADGTPLGSLRWNEETARPALSAVIVAWTNGVPAIRIRSNAPTTLDAVRRVLELRAGDRVWRDLAVTVSSVEDDGTPAAFAVSLPADLPADAVVALYARAGLVSTAGPLPSTEEDELLTFRHAEPFSLRRASCLSRVRDGGEDRDARDGVALHCVAGEDVQLAFSATLDERGRKAFAAGLPPSVRVVGWRDHDPDGGKPGDPQNAPGSVALLRFDVPNAEAAFALTGALQAEDGRTLATPVAVSIRNGDPRPALVAPGRRTLLGDPGVPLVATVNAPAVDIDETRLARDVASTRFRLRSSRGSAAAYASPGARATLAADGWVRWRSRTAPGASLEFSTPAFDLSAQVSPEAVLAWALDWDTSRPVAGAQVELLQLSVDGATRVVARARIGEDGLATLPLPASLLLPDRKPGDTPPTWLLRATAGTRRAVLPLSDLDSPSASALRQRARRLFAVTDRPLYRAGDTVRFRAWLRERRGGRLQAPEARVPVELALVPRDDHRPIARMTATPDAEGAVDGEIVLPSQTVDGDYCLTIADRIDDAPQACVFVGTFRAQDLWIDTALDTPLLRDGDPLRLQVAAGYWSGGPAAGVPLSDVRLRATPASPAEAYPAFAAFAFGDASDLRRPPALREPVAAPRVLDAGGKARVEAPVAFVPDDARPLPPFARIGASVQVALAGREPVSGRTVEAWYARHDRYVGLKLQPEWFDAATPLRVEAVVIDAAGHPQPGAEVEVRVERLGPDAAMPPESVGRCVVMAGHATDCDPPRKRSGVYRFTARSGDAAPATIERYVWNATDASLPASLPVRLDIVEAPARADAPVRLRVQQPYARADAWVVTSADGAVLDSRVLPLSGPDTTLLLPTHADGRNRVEVSLRVRERRPATIDPRGLRAPPNALTLTATVDVPRPVATPSLVLDVPPERAAPGAPVRLRLRNTGRTPRTVAVAVFDDAVRALAGDRWNAFDPQGDAWLGARDTDWRRRFSALGFDDWCRCGVRIPLPWEDVASAGQGNEAPGSPVRPEDTLPGDPESSDLPIIDRFAIEREGLTSVGDVLFDVTAADGGALRAASAPQFGFLGGGELDSVVVTGSRVRSVFTMPSAGSAVLSIDRAEIVGSGLEVVRDGMSEAGTHPDPTLSRPRAPVGAFAPSADARAHYGARLRDAFAETALWQPALVLAPGESREVALVAPDNLTRWRAVAWTVDAGEAFERVEATFDVGQPLEVRLQTPVRVYPDDRAVLVANVRHEGDAATVEAALQVDALDAATATALPLAKAGQGAIALAIAPGDADGAPRMLQAVAAARAGAHADATAQTIELASPAIETHRFQASWLGTSPLRLAPPALPAGATDPRLRITLLPGADALAHGWIDALHDYPHRCWEQMLSRAVGAAIALERGDGDRFPNAQATIDEALRNAPVFQSADGSFRYFADAFEDDAFDTRDRGAGVALTAWSVRALRLLQEQGHAVPQGPLLAADAFLDARSGDADDDDDEGDAVAGDRVRLALAAASRSAPPRAAVDRLWSRFPTLPLVAQVATARAMAAGAHPAAQAAVDALLAGARQRDDALRLRASPGDDRWMGSRLREQCDLLALLRDHPALAGADIRRRLLAGLGDLQAGGAPAADTQAAAICLIALRGVGGDGSTAALDIAQGARRTHLRLSPESRAPSLDQPLDARDLRKPLLLTPAIEGDAPASVVVEYAWREDARRAASSAIGFALQRRHETLRDGRWVPLAGAGLRDGDWVRVTLVLDNATTRYFVAITDAMPGGLRPTDLSLAGVAGVDVAQVSDPGDGWFATRRLDPRAPKFYAEFLPPGRHEVHYFARVGNAGDYLAPPATAELMYGEATRARTASARIAIEAAPPGTGD